MTLKEIRKNIGSKIAGVRIDALERSLHEIEEDAYNGYAFINPAVQEQREKGLLANHGCLPFDEAVELVDSSYPTPRDRLFGMMVWSDSQGVRMTCHCLITDGECPCGKLGEGESDFENWLVNTIGCERAGIRKINRHYSAYIYRFKDAYEPIWEKDITDPDTPLPGLPKDELPIANGVIPEG